MRGKTAAEQREGRNAPTQAVGVPAEDGVRLTLVEAPLQCTRQFQPGPSWRGRQDGWRSRCWPAQHGAAIPQLSMNSGTHVEGDADIVIAALDLVDDVDSARHPVQPDRATVPRGRVKRQIAVVFS